MKNIELQASTILEAVTASAIFLIIFTMSIAVLSKLPAGNEESLIMIEADRRLMHTVNTLSDGLHTDGKYDTDYDWGEIQASLSPYGEYGDLQQLTVTAIIKNSNKKISYRYVVERK